MTSNAMSHGKGQTVDPTIVMMKLRTQTLGGLEKFHKIEGKKFEQGSGGLDLSESHSFHL